MRRWTSSAASRRNGGPHSRETADHSLPYITAAALVDGEITSRQFDPARFTDPALLASCSASKCGRHAELSALYPAAVGNIVTLRYRDGRVVTVAGGSSPGPCAQSAERCGS